MIERLGSGLLAALTDEQVKRLEPISRTVSLERGEVLFRADDIAAEFYVLSNGVISLELEVASRPPVVIGTVGEGDVLGLSWLFPPYSWKWTARAVAPSTLVAFDAPGVRQLMDEDHEIGYRVIRAVAAEMKSRLTGVRLQLLDMYGPGR